MALTIGIIDKRNIITQTQFLDGGITPSGLINNVIPGGAQPVKSLNFMQYSTDAELRNDVWHPTTNPDGYIQSITFNPQNLHLQPVGSAWDGVSRAIRIVWPSAPSDPVLPCSTSAPGTCQHYCALPKPFQQEVWMQFYHRVSASPDPPFRTGVFELNNCNPARNPDYKFLHFYNYTLDGNGNAIGAGARMAMDWGNGQSVHTPPNGVQLCYVDAGIASSAMGSNTFFSGPGRTGTRFLEWADGGWHQFRVYWKMPSQIDLNDGLFDVRIDNIRMTGSVLKNFALNTLSRYFTRIGMGVNMNMGPYPGGLHPSSVGMWREFSNIDFYYQDPQWPAAL